MKIILATLGLMALLCCHAQGQSQSAKLATSAKTNNQNFDQIDFFHPSQQDNPELSRQLSAYGLLELDEEALASALHQPPEQLVLILPASGRSRQIELELARVEIASSAFSSVLASTGKPVSVAAGLHYRGVIKGVEGSVAALSLFEGEVMGLFSSKTHGNLVLGALEEERNKGVYILYEDHEALSQLAFDCATSDEGPAYTREQLQTPVAERTMNECVGIYLEVDHDIYQSKGGTTGAVNYITGLFNQVAMLYANEGISIKLSEMYIWDVPSPYNGTNSFNLLSQFLNYRPNFNGDLGQLVSYQASGGIAYLSGLCSTYSPRHSFSSINTTYAPVPTYSFSVMVMAHELGHLFGSRHTHACAWNGNGTALDACPGYTEGDCPLPGNPVGGGTIMSYCHISSTGINFSNGFGPQPGNVIRNAANAAPCLQLCGDDGGNNPPPTGDSCAGQELALSIVLDAYGSETSWELRDSNNTILYSGGPYPNTTNGALVEQKFCLPDGCYTFYISDSFGDGICCNFGNGAYSLVDTSGAMIASGGNFGFSESTGFCLPLADEPNPDPDPCLSINFNDYEILSFGGAQDIGYANLYENGKVLKIGGNAWKAIELEYEVKPGTVIEFEFGSTIQGEIHGIGFDDNNSISANRTFQLFGLQNWGVNGHNDYPGNATWRRYVIPVGEFYTGSFNRLFFVADHDRYPRNGNSYFRNIRIYDGDSCDRAAQLSGAAPLLLEENDQPATLKIFPNPTRGRITLNFLSPQAGQAYIQAFSLTGQLVLEQELGVLPGANQELLDVSALPSGTYVLKVLLGETQIVEKLTVIGR